MKRTVCSDGGSFGYFYLIRSCVKYDGFPGRKYSLLRLDMKNPLKSREYDLSSCVQRKESAIVFGQGEFTIYPKAPKF